MAEDLVNALCDWLAPRVPLQRSSPPFALFAHAAEELRDAGGLPANYADPYSVIRCYGGAAHGNDPIRNVNLQVYTVGTSAAAAMAQSEAIYAALLETAATGDDGKTPVRNVALTGFELLALFDLRPPGLIGRDAQGRVEAVFNVAAAYRRNE